MIDNGIRPDIKNSSIITAHNDVCDCSNTLWQNITTRQKISKSKFNQFKKCFGKLYIITANRRDLADMDELIKRSFTWINKEVQKPDKEDAKQGISLFFEYQKMLMQKSLLNDKV